MRMVLKVAVFICLSLIASASAFAYKDGDWQYWNTESVTVKLTDKIDAYVEEEFRFGGDISEFYYQHSHLQLDFKITDWFTLAPAYRQVFELDTMKDNWFTEYRPMVNGTVKWKCENWDFSNRVRISYRMFDIDKDDVWRFRNKLTIKTPWKWTALKINPWVADEIFLEENQSGVYRNRLYAGVGLKLTEHIKGDVFYLWQASEKGSSWTDYNVIGTKLKIVF
jgi:hypothetical protein